MKRKLRENQVKAKLVKDIIVKKSKKCGTSSKKEDYTERQCNFMFQSSSIINHVVCGFFSNSSQKDFAFSRGKVVDVSKVTFKKEGSKADIKTFISVNLFESICDMKTLAIPSKDHFKDSLIIVTDAGKLLILEYISNKKTFKKVGYKFAAPQTKFSMNSLKCFLTTHPSGYAFLLRKSLNEVNLFIRSKIKNEFFKQVIHISGEIHDMVGIPTNETFVKFAVLNSSEECKQNVVVLTFYKEERKLVKKVESLNSCFTAKILIPVAANGVGGVLIFSSSCIIYKSLDSDDIEIPVFFSCRKITVFNQCASQILKRKTDDKDKVFIFATHYMDMFYFALSEDGDLFEVSILLNEKKKVTELKFLKIESWPSAKHLCMLEKDYLFVTFGISNHCLFRINHMLLTVTKDFGRRLCTKKFTLLKSIQNNFPVFDFLVEDFADRYSKLYLVSRKWPHSAINILELGNKIICSDFWELNCDPVIRTWLCEKDGSGISVGTNDLPRFEASSSINTSADVTLSSSHKTLLVSKSSSKHKLSLKDLSKHKPENKQKMKPSKSRFVSKSNVSSKTENSVKSKKTFGHISAPDSNQICRPLNSTDSTEYLLFMSHSERTSVATIEMSLQKISIDVKEHEEIFNIREPTLLCIPFGETGGILQVTPSRFIYVKKGIIDWTWENKQIINCVATRYYILLYSMDGLLHYISNEKDEITVPLPYDKHKKLTCLAIGEKRKISDSPLMALALKNDSVYIIYFKNQKEVCELNYICSLKYDAVNYLEIVSLKTTHGDKKNSEFIFASNEEYLFIGLKSAIVIYKLNYYEDPLEVKTYHFYSKSLVMCKITLWEKPSILVYSLWDKTKKWILYHHKNNWRLQVCNFDVSLKHVMSFNSKRFQNQLLMIDSNQIIQFGRVTRLEKCFSKAEIPLSFTPRLLIQDEILKKLLILESEKICFEKEKYSNKEQIYEIPNHLLRNETGRKEWISCIEIIDPKHQMKKPQKIFLEKSDIILCGQSLNSPAPLQLDSTNNSTVENILVLGILSEFGERCKKSGVPIVCSYKISFKGDSFSNFVLTDRIFLDAPPSVMKISQGKIFIAEGNHLGIYTFDMAKLKLVLVMKKKLFDYIATMDVSLDGKLILIGYSTYNISIVKVSNLEVLFEDYSHRPIKSAVFMEDSKFAIADTFGNIFIMTLLKKNLPFEHLLKEEFELKIEFQLHVGEQIVKVLLRKLHPAANPYILYGSIHGLIGSLLELSEGATCLEELQSFLKCMEPHIYKTNLTKFHSLCDQAQGATCLEELQSHLKCMEPLICKSNLKNFHSLCDQAQGATCLEEFQSHLKLMESLICKSNLKKFHSLCDQAQGATCLEELQSFLKFMEPHIYKSNLTKFHSLCDQAQGATCLEELQSHLKCMEPLICKSNLKNFHSLCDQAQGATFLEELQSHLKCMESLICKNSLKKFHPLCDQAQGAICLEKLQFLLKFMEPFICKSNLKKMHPLCDQAQFVIGGDLSESCLSNI